MSKHTRDYFCQSVSIFLQQMTATRGRIFEFLVIKHCSINANGTFMKGFSALKKCNLIEIFLPKQEFFSLHRYPFLQYVARNYDLNFLQLMSSGSVAIVCVVSRYMFPNITMY